MTAALGTGKGTCRHRRLGKGDLLIVMAVNAASNAPRMLTALADAAPPRRPERARQHPLVEAASRRTHTCRTSSSRMATLPRRPRPAR